MLTPMYVENGSGNMLTTKRSASVAPEMNIREHVMHMPLPSANKGVNSDSEIQSRHHRKSKTGLSIALQKGLMLSKKNCLKNEFV